MLKRWASLLPLSASPGLANRKQYKREIETSSQIGTATENAFVEVSAGSIRATPQMENGAKSDTINEKQL
jgi:hypothetical protein